MLWFNGKGVAHFKKRGTELLKIPKSPMERFTKWKDLIYFFEFGWERGRTCSFF